MRHQSRLISISSLALVMTLASCQTILPEEPPTLTTASAPRTQQTQKSVRTCSAFWLASENLCAEIQWIHLPPAREPSGELLLSFSSGTKFKDPVQLPVVKLWMKMKQGKEHGSDPVILEREAAGRYRARGVNFRMSGGWQIWVQLRDRNNGQTVVDQARQDVQIR